MHRTIIVARSRNKNRTTRVNMVPDTPIQDKGVHHAYSCIKTTLARMSTFQHLEFQGQTGYSWALMQTSGGSCHPHVFQVTTTEH